MTDHVRALRQLATVVPRHQRDRLIKAADEIERITKLLDMRQDEQVVKALARKDREIDQLRATLVEVRGAMVAGLPAYWEKGGPLWARVTTHIVASGSSEPEFCQHINWKSLEKTGRRCMDCGEFMVDPGD